MSIALLCELGREEVRFAIVDVQTANAPVYVQSLQVADFTTFTDAIIHYLKKVEIQDKISYFALAVAGIVRGNTVGATNGRWLLSVSGLTAFLSVKPFILNDFAASAYALKALPTSAFKPLGPAGGARPEPETSFALIGPQDGLGVAGLVSQGANNFVVQSEAGHASISPVNQDAQSFLVNLKKKHRTTYAEHLLSEDGLRRAYSFFANDGSVEVSPATVTRIISQIRTDGAARAAVDLYIAQLAAFSRDIVLTFGTWGGVYYSGGTVNSLFEQLSSPSFRAMFAEGHSYSRLLREIPMAVVSDSQTVLIGLAAAIRDVTRRQ